MADSTISAREKTLAGLTRSDRQFLLAYSESRTLVESAYRWAKIRRITLKSRDVAAKTGSRKLIEIRRKIAALGSSEDFFEYLGLSLAGVARALSEGMSATKTVPLMVNGKIVDAGPYPDHATRIAAATLAAKLRGDLSPRPPAVPAPGDGCTFSFVVPKKEEPREPS